MSHPSSSTAHLRPLVPYSLPPDPYRPSSSSLYPDHIGSFPGTAPPGGHDGHDGHDGPGFGGDDSDDGATMFADLSFAEVVDELIARFLINLPREETTLMRVYWQAEQAHWFYEDYIRPLNPSLPSMRQAKFTEMLIQTSPIYRSMGEINYDDLWAEYVAYKMMVPCCGGILVNQTGDRVLMVRGWKAGASWCFPRGKINKDEPEEECAVREVYEEVGFDITRMIHTAERVQTQINAQTVTMFIIPGIDEKTTFEAQTKKEIGAIEWVRVIELPTWSGKKVIKPEKGKKAKRFYNVTPFVGPLKLWLKAHGYSAHPHTSSSTPGKKKRSDRAQALDPVAKFRQLQPYFADSEGGDSPSGPPGALLGERELQPYFSDMSGNEAFSDEDALQVVATGKGWGGGPYGGGAPSGLSEGKTSARVQRALERITTSKLQGGGGAQAEFYDFGGSFAGPRPPAQAASQSRKMSTEEVHSRQSAALDQLFASFMDRQSENMKAGKGEGDAQGERGDDNKAGLERLFGDMALGGNALGANGQEGGRGGGGAETGNGRGREEDEGRRGAGADTPEDIQRREEDDAVAMLLGSISHPSAGARPTERAAQAAVQKRAAAAGQAAEPKTEKAKGLLAMLNSRPMATAVSSSGVGPEQSRSGSGMSGGALGAEKTKKVDLLAVLSPYKSVNPVPSAQVAAQYNNDGQNPRAGSIGTGTAKAVGFGPTTVTAAEEERARKQRALLEQITGGMGLAPPPGGGGRGEAPGTWWPGPHQPSGWESPPPPPAGQHQQEPRYAQENHANPAFPPSPQQQQHYPRSPAAAPAPPQSIQPRPDLNDKQRNLLSALGMGMGRGMQAGDPGVQGPPQSQALGGSQGMGLQQAYPGPSYSPGPGYRPPPPMGAGGWAPQSSAYAPLHAEPGPPPAAPAGQTQGWGQGQYHPAHIHAAQHGPQTQMQWPSQVPTQGTAGPGGPSIGAANYGGPRPAAAGGYLTTPPFHMQHPHAQARGQDQPAYLQQSMARPPAGVGPGGELGGMMGGQPQY